MSSCPTRRARLQGTDPHVASNDNHLRSISELVMRSTAFVFGAVDQITPSRYAKPGIEAVAALTAEFDRGRRHRR